MPSAAGKHAGWIALTLYTLFLAYLALRHSKADMTNFPLWHLRDSRQFLAWILGLARGGLADFAYFIPLGFITTLAVSSSSRRFRGFPVHLPAIGAASTLTVLVRAVEIGWPWHFAAAVGLTLPLGGCLFGVWIGMTWLRGRLARLWLLPKIAVLALLIVSFIGIILWLSVQEAPLPFEAARVTSAEKRRLTYLIRSKSPRSLTEGQTHTLRLSEHDLNVLLAWGLSLGSPDRKAKVSLEPDSALLVASIGLTLGAGTTHYLNLMAAGIPEIQNGALNLCVEQLQIGAVKAPRWLCNLLSSVVTSRLRHDPSSKPFLDAIQAATIGPESIEVTYGRPHLPPGFREDLFGPTNASQDVLASVQAQVERLLAVASRSPDKQPSFGECFETVFALARERSVESDPVNQNRAGIFALGILLGHPRVEEFLGPVIKDLYSRDAQRLLARVPLRGRSDWTKHFCVSAAMTLLSDELVSDAAGLLKEELDAGIDGSGFSFTDLLADRAGTTFAIWATRDEASARAMQERISSGFQVEDFFPPASDLPEGISDAQLQLRYGGVGGEQYGRLVEEIERRITACAAYHRPR